MFETCRMLGEFALLFASLWAGGDCCMPGACPTQATPCVVSGAVAKSCGCSKTCGCKEKCECQPGAPGRACLPSGCPCTGSLMPSCAPPVAAVPAMAMPCPIACPVPANVCLPEPLPIACGTTMPAPVACPPAKPAPKRYQVRVRVPDSAVCGGMCPEMMLTEGARGSAQIGCATPGGMKSRGVCLRLTRDQADTVRMAVQLETSDPTGLCQRAHAGGIVPLNKPTDLALSGAGVNGGLPEKVQVTVTEVPPPQAPCPPVCRAPMRVQVAPPIGYCPPGARVPEIMMVPPMPPTCPLPPPMLPGNVVMPVSLTPPAPPACTRLCLVEEDGCKRVKCQVGDGSCLTFKSKTWVKAPGVGPLKVSAGRTRMHVTGKNWKATADGLALEAGRVVLTGHVRLTSETDGTVKAERVEVHPTRGTVEVRLGK